MIFTFSECRDAGFAVYSMRIHRDLKVLNTVHEANWEKCKENCDNVNKLCRNFIYDVRSTMYLNQFKRNKFALLWGEAQLCLPYVCL